jgi:hypothetical protein
MCPLSVTLQNYLIFVHKFVAIRPMIANSQTLEESSLLGCGIVSKRRLTPFLHGSTSQKTAFFIVTAVKTSNLLYSQTLTGNFILAFFCASLTTVWLTHVERGMMSPMTSEVAFTRNGN